MKKLLLAAALALAVVGSWAFYPKAAEPVSYMMIISNPSRGLGNNITITTVAPDGTQQEVSTEIKANLFTSRDADAIEVHKLELAALNTYSRQGWHLVSVTPAARQDNGTTSGYQTVYLLAKQ